MVYSFKAWLHVSLPVYLGLDTLRLVHGIVFIGVRSGR